MRKVVLTRSRLSIGRVRRLSVAVPLMMVALALSGCLSSGYTYVSHDNPDNTNVYFKVPSQWKLFNPGQLLEAANGHLSIDQINQIEAGGWLAAFSASPTANAKTIAKQTPVYGDKYPVGVVFGKELNATERDSFSLASLRSIVLGADPLAGESQYNVLSYSEFTQAGGIRGSKLEVDISQSNNVVTTFAQVTVVDQATNWVFAIGLGCDAGCWGANQGLMNQVLNSWNVKVR